MEGEHGTEPGSTGDTPGADDAPVGAVTPAAQPPAPPPPPPQEPPAYVPPAYAAPPAPPAYAAPPAPPAYAAPAAPPAYVPPAAPPAYAPGTPPPYAPPGAPPSFAPPAYVPVPVPPAAAPSGGRSRTLMVVGIVVVFLLILLGGGGFFINSSLSSTYSPQRAVTDYFAAQSRADVNGMLSNATYLKGDSTFAQFFTTAALTAMMKDGDNKSVSSVKVTSTSEVDSATSKVDVTMTWGGNPETKTYTVRKDTSRQHDLFYYSWRVDIPFATINVTLPNQPGTVQVDGIDLPSASQKSVQVIQGYHSVTMKSTDFYDETSLAANGVDSDTASVTFQSKLGSAAMTAAGAAIKGAFNNVTCDAANYGDCPNHAYHGPATLTGLPGGDIVANSAWNWVFAGDPTSGMALVVTTEAGKITASGKCAMTLTVDGSKTYNFTGTWTGTLTWGSGSFGSDVIIACDSARA